MSGCVTRLVPLLAFLVVACGPDEAERAAREREREAAAAEFWRLKAHQWAQLERDRVKLEEQRRRLAELIPTAAYPATFPVAPTEPAAELPADFLGRWGEGKRRLQISRTMFIRGVLVIADLATYEVVGRSGGSYRIRLSESRGTSELELRLEGAKLLQAMPGLDGAVSRVRAGPVGPQNTWHEHAEAVFERVMAQADFREGLRRQVGRLEGASANDAVVDAYSRQVLHFAEIGVVYRTQAGDRRWLWRFDEDGAVETESIPQDVGVHLRQADSPFRALDGSGVPEDVVDWLRKEAVPRILAEMGPYRHTWFMTPTNHLPGIPGLRLFDSTDTLLKVCPDARRADGLRGGHRYQSNTCGDGLLGPAWPVEFTFRGGRLREVHQLATPNTVDEAKAVMARGAGLGGQVCGVADGQDSWSCPLDGGDFRVTDDSISMRAWEQPPERRREEQWDR